MAVLPLNTFRTKPFELTTTTQIVYTTPEDLTSIILGAQASNIGTEPVTITFKLTKNGVDYVLLKEFEIPVNDAAEVVTGKLVVEEGNTLSASVSRDDSVILVLSLLETTNE